MEKKVLRLENFLSDISPDFEPMIREINDRLVQSGCEVKLQEAKSGHVVSFADPATKKVVANFVARKKGPVIRIYGDHYTEYLDLINTLPEKMRKDIEKASVCRRLIDPTKCNARCPMGYELTIGETLHQKCRYSCFMFPVNGENTPAILGLLEREVAERAV